MPAALPPAPSTGIIDDVCAVDTVDDFSWDMLSLGLEEPLPSQDIIDEM